MRKSLCCALSLLLSVFVRCQKILPDFGKVSSAEFDVAAPYFEPTAAAVKLFEVSDAEFYYLRHGVEIQTEHRLRVKILSKDGFKYAAFKLPYYSRDNASRIKSLKGAVYNKDADGNIVVEKLEKKDFFHDKFDKDVAIINFAFPNVRVGSVVEFSYTKIESDVDEFDAWEVQGEIPCLYAANLITIPDNSRLRQKYFGNDSIEHRVEKVSGGRERHVYQKENIPSFHSEPYMTAYRDNLLRVSYYFIPYSNFIIDSITSSDMIWRFAGLNYLHAPFFREQLDTLIPGTESLVKAVKALPTQAEKIQAVFRAVKNQSPEKVEQRLIPKSLSQAWQNKNGSSAELNMMVMNLLRKVGVSCYPLLVSTRRHGQIAIDFPSTAQFNGLDVLAVDSEKTYILDASLKSQSSSTPPPNVLNRIALLLMQDTVRWIKVEDERILNKQDVVLNTKLDKEGFLKGEALISLYDYAKMAVTDSLDGDERSHVQDQKLDGLNVNSQKFIAAKSDDEPVQQRFSFTYQLQKTGNFYFLKPQFFTPFKKNPFVNEKRVTDIDFGSKQQLTLSLTIEIPPDCLLEALPKNLLMRAPDSSFLYKRVCTRSATTISYTQSFEISRSLFYREDYPALYEFFRRLYAFMNEELVFRLKG